jgi:drug/metabolite transporter (DMT)-like permease
VDALTHTMNARQWALLLLLALLWGGSFFSAELALRELSPQTLVFFRVALAAMILHAVRFLRAPDDKMPRDGRFWAQLSLMGLLNNVLPFNLIFWGQTHIASGLAAVLNATTPVFGVLVAHALTADEKLTRQKLAGVSAGLAGVVLVIGPPAVGELGLRFSLALLAQLAVLAAACCYALAAVLGRRFRRYSPLVVASGQLTASATMMLPIVLASGDAASVLSLSMTTIGALLALALLSTAVAYWIYFHLLSSAGATNLLLVTFLIPITALLLGIGLLGERLTVEAAAGMAVIAAGLFVIDGRAFRYRSRVEMGARHE